MYEQLSKQVDRVVKVANEIAHEYELEYVGTEHILLAISREAAGMGAAILNESGATYEKIKGNVDKLMQSSLEDTWVFGRLPGTPHFRNVVASAIEEARKLRSKEVCTEHLLLGLLREKGCIAHQTLQTLGVTPTMVRDKIKKHTTPSG